MGSCTFTKDTQVHAPGISFLCVLVWVHTLVKKALSWFITWHSSRCWCLCMWVPWSWKWRRVRWEWTEGMLAWWGSIQGQNSVCFYSSFLAVSSSSWDQLQDMPLSLAASVWGQWWEMLVVTFPSERCFSVFFLSFVSPSSGRPTPAPARWSGGRISCGLVM